MFDVYDDSTVVYPGHGDQLSPGAGSAHLRGLARTGLVNSGHGGAAPKLTAMRVGIEFRHNPWSRQSSTAPSVVSFDGLDTWPSLIAASDAGELRFGLDAATVRHEPGWSVLRSFKRLLSDAGPRTTVELAGRCYPLADLFAGFLAQLKCDLQTRSNAELARGERVEAAISVPANASSAQRFLTLDAFTQAGFEVIALLNELSAAGFSNT